ncbi:hypothetical protein CNBD4010 [Cryptococcus deneoformans B-3501A]|uniref:Expressed protein n=1 Tax=Cryptococcus deneoformans (strain JEC21 / ATCC MYA-565) TaxID=214684 RepID=Q5KIN3_CRYD1|nr:expressed protein [Cryptococcus neoformans var. neoformans JEC21]XP_775672.1 hypothetical protein CNBD4010 [Cryptococcus neoformans var. neoformans B-3501A]AAW43128.1 expressed protein [Cryptococcus neoformans var. neoformans JEC21]EAL21025.1 hypothetical protein CNBD4010 [Cryptococcus neoformans var. neoformans B-3501A]
MRLLSWIVLPLIPFVSAGVSTIYWPVSNPDPSNPWVIGEKNLLAWTTGSGTGVQSFDVQLHNSNRSVMVGFLPIALRVPMERLPSGYKNYGGEMEVDLGSNIPTGDGFYLLFMNTYHGEVYAKSKKFSIYASTPANFTSADLPTATVTATLSEAPNPTQQWAITLNGVDQDATATATSTSS